MRDVALFAFLYYSIGVAWLALGVAPGGWCRHNMSLPAAALYVVIVGSIWPLLLIYILIMMVIYGEDDIPML